jgi:hypothetical protein
MKTCGEWRNDSTFLLASPLDKHLRVQSAQLFYISNKIYTRNNTTGSCADSTAGPDPLEMKTSIPILNRTPILW